MYDAAMKAPGANKNMIYNPATAQSIRAISDTYNRILDDYADVNFSRGVSGKISSIADAYATGKPVEGASFSAKDANQLIKRLNLGYKNGSDAQRAAILELKEPIFNFMDTIANDSNNPSAQLFNQARVIRKQVGDVYNQNDIVDLITKKKAEFTDALPPEKVASNIFSSQTTETNLNKVQKALLYGGPNGELSEKGQMMCDTLRASKINDILSSSTRTVKSLSGRNDIYSIDYKALVKNVQNLSKPSLEKLLGSPELADRFGKFIDTVGYWQKNIDAAKANKASALISAKFQALSSVSSDIMATTKTLTLIKTLFNVFDNYKDAQWVKSNLLQGAGTKPIVVSKARTYPSLDKLGRLLKSVPASIGGMAAGQYAPSNDQVTETYPGGL